MSASGPVKIMSNCVYRYDGTFQGLLCCLAECYRERGFPQGIQLLDEPQATLFPVKIVETDRALAQRAQSSIPKKISPEAYDLARQAFLTCLEEKELKILRFLVLGYRVGPKVTRLSTEDRVYTLSKAVKTLQTEAHRFVEFLRFSDCGGCLVSAISPQNIVLPIVAPYFCDRLPAERFMIYDRTHHMGFLQEPGEKRGFFQAEDLTLPDPGEEERAFRQLWKRFYDTVAVEGRVNPKLQKNMLPLRFRKDMTEFQK